MQLLQKKQVGRRKNPHSCSRFRLAQRPDAALLRSVGAPAGINQMKPLSRKRSKLPQLISDPSQAFFSCPIPKELTSTVHMVGPVTGLPVGLAAIIDMLKREGSEPVNP